jgi:hypothetical protein
MLFHITYVCIDSNFLLGCVSKKEENQQEKHNFGPWCYLHFADTPMTRGVIYILG